MLRVFSLILLAVLWMAGLMADTYVAPSQPYAPQTGTDGSEAIVYTDVRIISWATEVTTVNFGLEIDGQGGWKDTDSALGMPNGDNTAVLVLGRGGDVTLGFSSGIADGEGFDFVVFENAITRTFLELAFVEVSSDGVHFVRFPGYSATAGPVGSYGTVMATDVHGLAGKYSWADEGMTPCGTPFDLATLDLAYAAAINGYAKFSDAYSSQLLENYPHLDLSAVRFVRIVDIVGDGSSRDCEGYVIYDPYPTWGTAGFDLDAVGVMNTSIPYTVGFSEWSSGLGLSGGRGSDQDLDGWADGLEYLFGTDPRDRHDRPAISIEPGGAGGQIDLVFHTSAAAEGSLRLYSSRDAQTWEFLGGGPLAPPGPDDLVWIGGRPYRRQLLSVPEGGLLQFRDPGMN